MENKMIIEIFFMTTPYSCDSERQNSPAAMKCSGLVVVRSTLTLITAFLKLRV
jgi:hypothetical protein